MEQDAREIIQRLKEKGVKVEEIAVKLGYSYAGVMRWWRGDVKPKEPVFDALKAMLKRVEKGGKL